MTVSLKKIIQVNSSSALGGGSQVMWDIIDGLGRSFCFAVVAPKGIFLNRYQQKGIATITLQASHFISKTRELKRVFKKEKPGIVHAHGTRAAIWTRLAVIGIKPKPCLIYTLHGLHIARRSFFMRWACLKLEQFLNQWTDCLVCVSETDKNLVLKHKLISPSKIKVIKNGIEIDSFQVGEEVIKKTKRELGLENSFILAAVGRLHPQKDFSTIFKALKILMVKEEIPNLKLLIVGDGPLRKTLEQEVKELGLTGFVKFLGFRKDVPALINLSDVVILSTHWEGLPLVPLEAWASSTPIAVSDIAEIREIVRDGETGCLFQPGAERDLAEKIIRLTKDEELRERMKTAGLEFVRKNFSKQRMTTDYEKLYQRL